MNVIEFFSDKKRLQKIAQKAPTLSRKYVTVKQSEIQKLFIIQEYLKTKPTNQEIEKLKFVLEEISAFAELNQTMLGIDENYIKQIAETGVMSAIEKLWLSRPQTFAEWLKGQIPSQDSSPMRMPRADGKMVAMNISRSENHKCQLMAQYLKAYPDVDKQQFDEMLGVRGLADFRQLIKDYKYSDYVQELRQHGASYLAVRVDFERDMDKKYKKLEKQTEKLDKKFQ
ncbi:MAG: hypothetical protein IJA69_01065 [Clostridia bacterium]|nr:hypothetical protein [Clostridia bacterium]